MTTVEVKTAGVTSDSCMVALYPDPGDVRSAISGLPEGHEDPSTWHLTLAYLGKADRDGFDPQAVHAAVEGWARSRPPMSGELSGVGRFVGSEEEGDPVWLHADLAALPDFRQALVQMLKSAGLPVSETHGFTAHCTLAYVAKGSSTPIEPAATPVPVRFTHVAVTVGDVPTFYPLGGPETKVLEPPDPAAVEKAVRDAHRARHQARLDSYEKQLAEGIVELWARQKATVLARLLGPKNRRAWTTGRKADPNYTLNSVKWTAEAIQFAIRLLAQIFGLSWADTARRLGQPGLPEPDPTVVNEDIAPFARNIVAALTDKQQKVQQVIEQAHAEGKTLEEAAALVEREYDRAETSAKSIARSVNTGLANRASLSVAQEVGAIEKQWLSSHDLRVRDTHKVSDGQSVALDAKFSVGDFLLDHPGDMSDPAAIGEWAQCRCTTLYALGGQSTGYAGHDWSDVPTIPKTVPATPRTLKAYADLLARMEVKQSGLAWIDELRDPHTGKWQSGGRLLSQVENLSSLGWKPVMSRDEAEVWAKDSAIPQLGTFVGRAASVAKIRKEGFSLNRTSAGRVFGDGVYMGIAGLEIDDPNDAWDASPTWTAWDKRRTGAVQTFAIHLEDLPSSWTKIKKFEQDWLKDNPEPEFTDSKLSDPSVALYRRMKDDFYDEAAYSAAQQEWEDDRRSYRSSHEPIDYSLYDRDNPEPLPEDFPLPPPQVLRLKVNVRNPATINVGREGLAGRTIMVNQIPGFVDAYRRQGGEAMLSSAAITDALKALGYDSLIVNQGDPNDPGFDTGTGGPQVVVFDPKNVTVVDEPHRYAAKSERKRDSRGRYTKAFNPAQPRDVAGRWADFQGLKVQNLTMKTFLKHIRPGEPIDAGRDWDEVRSRGGYDDLRDSIAKEGLQAPVLVDMQTGEVKDGHHRAAALMDLGATHVPIIDFNTYGWPKGYS